MNIFKVIKPGRVAKSTLNLQENRETQVLRMSEILNYQEQCEIMET